MASFYKPDEMGDGDDFAALPGKVVKAMIGRFCLPDPKKAEKILPIHSIGICETGLVATDGNRMIVTGEAEGVFSTTDRRRALLEADRANIYGDGYDASRIVADEDSVDPENVPPEEPYPSDAIVRIIAGVNGMRPVCLVSPEFLRDVAAVALAAGAPVVELRIADTAAEEEVTRLGFRFTGEKAEPRFGEAFEVPFTGIIAARKGPRGVDQETGEVKA